jgi:hypothetical protein
MPAPPRVAVYQSAATAAPAVTLINSIELTYAPSVATLVRSSRPSSVAATPEENPSISSSQASVIRMAASIATRSASVSDGWR